MNGFEVPIHRSLTQVILIAGVPREFALLNGTLTAALVFGMHSLFALPLGIIAHMFAVRLTKRDPQFMQTFRRHLHQKEFYEP
jgi:type IV secretory pathway TrbD component